MNLMKNNSDEDNKRNKKKPVKLFKEPDRKTYYFD